MLRRVHFFALVALLLTANFVTAASLRSPHRGGAASHRRVAVRRNVAAPSVRPSRRHRIPWNPVLKGSHESQLRQNQEIDRLSLPRIANDFELQELELREELVPLNDSRTLQLGANLTPTRRYCRPWTRDFVEDLSEAFYEEFHHPLQLTSAVRTVEQQARLRRWNRNAAPIEGDTASSHLAGMSIDIGKRGLSRKEKKFLDAYILPLVQAGLVEAAEERRQACYHIMVSERYTGWHEEQQLSMGTQDKPAAP